MALRELFNTIAITAEFFRAYMGGAGSLEHRQNQGKPINQSGPQYTETFQAQEPLKDSEWECSGPIGLEEISTTKCRVTYDKDGSPIMNISVDVHDSRPGPYKLWSPIEGTVNSEGVGLGLFFFDPASGEISGDGGCADGTNTLGNFFRFTGNYDPSRALTNDRKVSDACFDNFENKVEILLPDSTGQMRVVTLQPPGNGSTAFFNYKVDSSGRTFLELGTGSDGIPVYVDLETFFGVSIFTDQSALNNTDRVPVDLAKLAYPKITIPTGAIELFPLLEIESSALLPSPESPLNGAESTPNPAPANSPETEEVSPQTLITPEIVRATPRVDGKHQTMYEFNCPAGTNIELTEINPANQDAIALYSIITGDGWHPDQINDKIESINDHQSIWEKFKQKLPKIFKKIFKIPEYPFTATDTSCNQQSIQTTLFPLSEQIIDDDFVRIIAMDSRQQMVIVTLSGDQAAAHLKPIVTVSTTSADGLTTSSMTDPVMAEEAGNQLRLIGEDDTSTMQTPKYGSILSPPDQMFDLRPGYSMEDLVHIARDPTTPVRESMIVMDNGGFKSINSFPSGIIMRFQGSKLSSDGTRLIIFAVNPLDLPLDTDQELKNLINTGSLTLVDGMFLIAVPDKYAWTPYTSFKNSDKTVDPSVSPTPKSHISPNPTDKYEQDRLALHKFTETNARKNRADIRKSRANTIATIYKNNKF